MVEGELQIEGEVIHVIVKRCFDLTGLLRSIDREENNGFPTAAFSRSDQRIASYSSNKDLPEKVLQQLQSFQEAEI